MRKNIVGILLAAGQSTRFGSNKLLHPLNKSKSIGQQSAHNLIQACPNSIAVINNTSSTLAESLSDTGLKIIENTEAAQGMGSSIACGVQASADADAWLIVLADMPFIQTQTIKKIIQNFKENKCIIAATYLHQQGHPVLFSQHFFKALTQLNSDNGAKNILNNNSEFIKLIEINDPGILQDIDLMKDLNI